MFQNVLLRYSSSILQLLFVKLFLFSIKGVVKSEPGKIKNAKIGTVF